MSDLLKLFQDSSSFQGSNASFIENLYERFLENPDSVELSWQKEFKALQNGSAYETPHSPVVARFAELSAKNEKALITYIMVGYPNESATTSIVRGLIKGGADIIELGFPFSDPLADGPVIQNASTVSLNNGTKIKKNVFC